METKNQPLASVETPTRSIWSIIIGIFTSPTQAMEDFKKKPTLLVVIILTFVLASIVGISTAKYSSMLQYDMLKTSTVIPAEILQDMKTQAESSNPFVSGLSGGVVVLVITLIAAGIAMFIGKFVFAGDANYKTIWAVVLLAGLISMVGGVLRIPMVLAKGSMLVSYGFAAAMPGKGFTSILYSILYYCDFFMIWSVIVEGIGLSKVLGISKGKGITTAAITSGLLIAVMITLSLVGMMFAGVEITFF
ncbi:MAG: YIP1 family protein [candidate division Zixibacteria bacterium]|nr:YIP1 family protein [candidate division Zixibacteria bacterium]